MKTGRRKVIVQGGPIINQLVVDKKSKNIVALHLNIEQKGCRIIGAGSNDEIPCIMIAPSTGNGLTTVELIEYKGWTIYCAQLGKCTLTMCLIKQ